MQIESDNSGVRAIVSLSKDEVQKLNDELEALTPSYKFLTIHELVEELTDLAEV